MKDNRPNKIDIVPDKKKVSVTPENDNSLRPAMAEPTVPVKWFEPITYEQEDEFGTVTLIEPSPTELVNAIDFNRPKINKTKEVEESRNNPESESEDAKEFGNEADQLLSLIGERARELGRAYDLYASVILAQALIASDFGKKRLAHAPYYNIFGIEAKEDEESVTLANKRKKSNGEIDFSAKNYRVYNSYIASINAYVDLLLKGKLVKSRIYQLVWQHEVPRYRGAKIKLKGKNIKKRTYAKKIAKIIKKYGLRKFDSAEHEFERIKLHMPLVEFRSMSDYTAETKTNSDKKQYGISFYAPTETPVLAAKSGVVADIGFDFNHGNYIILKHANTLYTGYSHLNSVKTFEGETVELGQVIGNLGTTGKTENSQLYFTVSLSLKSGYLNPRSFF